jgi:hypothetical protein
MTWPTFSYRFVILNLIGAYIFRNKWLAQHRTQHRTQHTTQHTTQQLCVVFCVVCCVQCCVVKNSAKVKLQLAISTLASHLFRKIYTQYGLGGQICRKKLVMSWSPGIKLLPGNPLRLVNCLRIKLKAYRWKYRLCYRCQLLSWKVGLK